MIEIRSFLRTPEGSFVLVEECVSPPPDLDYIEGAIEFSINGVAIISKQHWDYIDQLWFYISEMASDLIGTGMASTYFPDQPIKLSFEGGRGRVLVSLESKGEIRRVDIERDQLLQALRQAGLKFFARMSQIAPENASEYEIASQVLLGLKGPD